MHCHRFLFLHFLLTCHSYLPVLFQRNIFYFHLFPLVFVHCLIKKKVALAVVVVVAVADAAVGSVELQRERETHCQQCRASERLTANCRKK